MCFDLKTSKSIARYLLHLPHILPRIQLPYVLYGETSTHMRSLWYTFFRRHCPQAVLLQGPKRSGWLGQSGCFSFLSRHIVQEGSDKRQEITLRHLYVNGSTTLCLVGQLRGEGSSVREWEPSLSQSNFNFHVYVTQQWLSP